jgi:tetratricopeptide (TPR) repeat protein
MALLTGAGTLVMGAFYLTDEQTLEFQADIVDARSDRMLVPLEPLQGPRSAPLDLVRKVQERVSAALAGLFDPFMADWQFSSPQNLDAYRAYIDGLQEINRSRWSSAVPHLQRAISADPTYAPAKISLATAYLNMGGLEALSAADSLVGVVELQRDRLPFWEAVNLKWLRATLDGDAEAAYRAALENFNKSGNNSAYYFLGQEAMKVNRLEEAIQAFKGTRLDSPLMEEWVPYWRRLSDSYLMFGEPAKALDAAQRRCRVSEGFPR